MRSYFDYLLSQDMDPIKASRFVNENAGLEAYAVELAFGDGKVPSAVGRLALYLLYCGTHAYLHDAGYPIPKELLQDKKKAHERLPQAELARMGLNKTILNYNSKPTYIRDHMRYVREIIRKIRNDLSVSKEEIDLITLASRMNNEDVSDSTVRKFEGLLWALDSNLANKVINYLHDDEGGEAADKAGGSGKDLYTALRAVVKKLDGTGFTLTKTQIEKAKARPTTSAMYREYLSLRRQANKIFTTAFHMLINANNGDPLDVAVAEKKMKDKGFDLLFIPSASSGFKGRIGTDGKDIAYFTSKGEKLQGSITAGSTVKMNPKYDHETDNTYYMTVQAPDAITEGLRVYTTKYSRKSVEKKFQKADVVMSKLPTFIKLWQRDLKSDNPRVRMCAVAALLQYLTGSRVGSRTKTAASKKGGMTFGMISMRVKHLKITAQNIIFEYVGKKNQNQVHQLRLNNPTVKVLAKILTELKKNKSAEDMLFSLPKLSGNGYDEINWAMYNKYLISMGFTEGSHKLRHARGTLLVEKLLKETPWKPTKAESATLQSRQKSADNYMQNKVLSKVAALLGHKSAGGTKLSWRTSIKAYVKPDVVANWYVANKLRTPSWVPSKVEAD